MNRIEELTRECTAFRTWDAFRQELGKGYVPTLLTSRGQEVQELARALRSMGYRVYTGAN